MFLSLTAMNKLEKVALKRATKTGRPLVLAINNVHYFHHTAEGRTMLLQLQQRAETWAENGDSSRRFSDNATDLFFPKSY